MSFLVFLDCLIAAHADLWRTYDPDDYAERLRNCQRQRPEVVLAGGSTVSEGIDPRFLAGLTWQGQPLKHVYNLGLPGGTTAEVWHGVRHGLPRPPRLLIYGITASDLNDARGEPHGPGTLMSAHDVMDWARHRPGAAEWAIRHYLQARLSSAWQLYRYRNGIRLWAAERVETLWPGAFPEAAAEARANRDYAAAMRQPHGFAPQPSRQYLRYDVIRSVIDISPTFGFLRGFRLGEYLTYLHRLLDWGEERNVTTVLVDMPVSQDLEERLHPDAFALYRRTLADIERQRGVHVLRASREAVGLSDADFADLIHLNTTGSAKLSAWLRRQLDKGWTP
ncbi:MAG: hypothetical protein ACK4RK_12200 [Gemmataceae bacterium]